MSAYLCIIVGARLISCTQQEEIVKHIKRAQQGGFRFKPTRDCHAVAFAGNRTQHRMKRLSREESITPRLFTKEVKEEKREKKEESNKQ